MEKSKFLKQINKFSAMRVQKLDFLSDLTIKEGQCIVECGVMNGGSLMALAYNNTGTIWGFDSWEGCPSPSPEDISGKKVPKTIAKKGMFKGNQDTVFGLIAKYGNESQDFKLIKGWFNESIPSYLDQINNIGILHLDGDWYESVKVCLELLYDKVDSGGIVVIDDYNWWLGANKAVDEFIGDNVEIHTPFSAGAWFKKP